MRIAVIPARVGSKRIPGKNVRDFCGHPVIKYSIDAALESESFDRVIVSTDCTEIANVASKLGAEVPFRRPSYLSDDHTPTIPVIRHAIEQVGSDDDPVRHVCCIYATAPFLRAADLREAFGILSEDRTTEFCFPVTTYPFPIFRSLRRENGQVSMFFPEHENSRSQDLPEAWHDAGQFYWGTAEAWRKREGVFTSKAIGLPIPRHLVQDIDTQEDWARAELMYRSLQRSIASSGHA